MFRTVVWKLPGSGQAMVRMRNLFWPLPGSSRRENYRFQSDFTLGTTFRTPNVYCATHTKRHDTSYLKTRRVALRGAPKQHDQIAIRLGESYRRNPNSHGARKTHARNARYERR